MVAGDSIVFITEDKDFKIIFTKQKLLFGDSQGLTYKINIQFFNNIGILIKEISLSEIDIDILLDNFYFHLETNQDCSVVSRRINENEICVISIILKDCVSSINLQPNKYYKKEIFRLSSFNGEVMSTILQFDISDKFPIFISILENILSEDEEINIIDSISVFDYGYRNFNISRDESIYFGLDQIDFCNNLQQ